VDLPQPTVLPGMSSKAGVVIASNGDGRGEATSEIRHARSLNGQPIGVLPDFITEKERERLCKFVSKPDAPWETYLPESDIWHGRMINPRSMPAPIMRLVREIRKRTVAQIRQHYAIDDEIYGDTLQLVRWRPGDSQRAHADCEEPDGRPNATPWRAFASIIYLNDSYEGGGLFFPQRDWKPEIKPRMLAYFPSTNRYLHGVEPISSGVRYTLSCFYTFDPSRHDGHPV